MPTEGNIIIRRAKVNNLKDITVEIPRNRLVVVTGISGSGKSSLAFDTLFAEGQRRFAESLSSYARQFLGRMSKPDVEMIEGIPPAIAIEQKVNIRNPRSTAATYLSSMMPISIALRTGNGRCRRVPGKCRGQPL